MLGACIWGPYEVEKKQVDDLGHYRIARMCIGMQAQIEVKRSETAGASPEA